jgi:NAD(P)H-hydrate epimerase
MSIRRASEVFPEPPSTRGKPGQLILLHFPVAARILQGKHHMITCLRPLSREEVRRLDTLAAVELQLPTLVLMENAGRGAAGWFAEFAGAMTPMAEVRSFSPPPSRLASGSPHGPALPRVLIFCGPGNNGGDGGVVARHLDAWGFPVRVIWFSHSDQLRGDAATQCTILQKSGVKQSVWFDEHAADIESDTSSLNAALAEADWLVDGLFGTGLSRPVEGPLRKVIEAMNASGKPVFALDLPSGLDADTGQPLGVAVRACATATFVAPKLGFTAPGAADYTGTVVVIDIGLPRRLLEPFLPTQSGEVAPAPNNR